MRRFIVICLTFGLTLAADAQYIPAYPKREKQDPGTKYWSKGNTFRHLEISLSAGTTGVGLDLAVPLCPIMQIRLGYDYLPQFSKTYNMNLAGGGQAAKQYDSKGNRINTPFTKIEKYIYEQMGGDLKDHIVLNGKLTMQNFKFLIDFYPFKYDNHWHFTAGFYYGDKEYAKAENDQQSNETISLRREYNQRYEEAGNNDEIKSYGKLNLYPGDYAYNKTNGLTEHKTGDPYLTDPSSEGKVSISTTSNAFKPYIGAGYTGRLVKSRDDWKISAEIGVLIWGGTPVQRLHDGADLSKNVIHIPGSMGRVVGIAEAMKVFPVISVRFAKTIF